ncbi:hypothetical protein LCGC14_1728370 [marine sediment metagenome]|uniref:Uncharacterized protein n=1 Tax=marine sediment metagenome TaxID=412755 RepID=A0A0F9HY36_9ZZZZ
MTLQANALCILEDIRLRVPDMVTMTAAHSGSFEAFVNEASDFAEDYCDRTFLSGSLETEIFDGRGYADNIPAYHTKHVLNQAPISTTPVLHLYRWDGDSWEELNTTTYTQDTVKGTIYFPTISITEYYRQPGYVTGANAYFVQGTGNHKAEYYYGYTFGTYGGGTLPLDLRGAVAKHAIWLYNSTSQLGIVSNSSADDRTYTYDPNIPKSILRVYDRYKR